MTPNTPDPVPAADPADLAEQSVEIAPEDEDTGLDTAELRTKDNWEANPADVVEQSIPVPMDDEYEDEETEAPA
ncbi:hypothetical protein [Nocardia cyriacigeorgica]|uniref:hypothetical protein n=1 Tax=Nocardia cyriacigeorgica TaxID=135487 RepID=UPI0018946F44|nr:hypothetical protein [Nocardia cyriacigeorgica]MBF6494776.1 hypothetical protein [Nocardia cyriacigeorgica]